MKEDLIAPCGMNCGLCVSYLAMQEQLNRQGFRKRYCAGCRPRGENCTFMGHHCDLLRQGLVRFCYQCGSYPCSRLRALDKRYRTKYHLSIIENLETIREHGLEAFLDREETKWRCATCGGVICCHHGLCLHCRLDELRQNKRYRWGEENEVKGRNPG